MIRVHFFTPQLVTQHRLQQECMWVDCLEIEPVFPITYPNGILKIQFGPADFCQCELRLIDRIIQVNP